MNVEAAPVLPPVEPSLSMDFINMARGAEPSQMVVGFIPKSLSAFVTTLSKSVTAEGLATPMPHRQRRKPPLWHPCHIAAAGLLGKH
jgi:hypothetical protein